MKSGTSIELMYNEIKRPDVIARIKDSQYDFYQKVLNLTEEEAVVRSLLELCKDTPIVHYYESLSPDNKERNISDRETRISEAETSMMRYYASIVDVKQKSTIYSNFVDDRHRKVITRWRLSNHKLRIETGRYHVPFIERDDRKCFLCNVLEDEHHAIFTCPSFDFIRQDHPNLLEKYSSVGAILNPCPGDIYEVAKFLSEIDNVLKNR